MNMMNYQFINRNQQSKGLTVKQALQFVLLLGVGIWLLYQIKHSRGDIDDSTPRELNEEKGSNMFGRKGATGWSNHSDGSGMYMKDVNLLAETENKEVGGSGGDELSNEPKELHVYEDSNPVFDIRRNVEGTSKQEMENGEGFEGKSEDSHKSEQNSNFTIPDGGDEAVEKERDGFLEQQDGVANTTTSVSLLHDNDENVKEDEEKDGIHSFHDENGVPQDPNGESIENEPIDLGSQNTMVRSMPFEDLKGGGASDIGHASDITIDERDKALVHFSSVFPLPELERRVST